MATQKHKTRVGADAFVRPASKASMVVGGCPGVTLTLRSAAKETGPQPRVSLSLAKILLHRIDSLVGPLFNPVPNTLHALLHAAARLVCSLLGILRRRLCALLRVFRGVLGDVPRLSLQPCRYPSQPSSSPFSVSLAALFEASFTSVAAPFLSVLESCENASVGPSSAEPSQRSPLASLSYLPPCNCGRKFVRKYEASPGTNANSDSQVREIRNPSPTIVFNVSIAVTRSYSCSDSGNSSYAIRHGCSFRESSRTAPHRHPSASRCRAQCSCVFRASISFRSSTSEAIAPATYRPGSDGNCSISRSFSLPDALSVSSSTSHFFKIVKIVFGPNPARTS